MAWTITRNAPAVPAARAIREDAIALTGAPSDFDPLLERVGDARFVLIGEATHGTHEFYRIRGEITKRLIRELGFHAVAVEADWPDAWRVNRYVRGDGPDADATDALSGFERFPQWMWRNADVLDFVGWLKGHNEGLSSRDERVGFYGLDLYSLHASMDAVLQYLDVVDPDAARRARERYACFDRFGDDPAAYGHAAALRLSASCEDAVIGQLLELQRSAGEYARRDGRVAADALFFAEQNARLVRNAERYYRMMFLSGERSWNLRDRHMAETLDALSAFLSRADRPARMVVWAHNSHLGDARHTDMSRRGELNLGQLTRQAAPDATVLVGFTTYAGTVTAARDWGGDAERRIVRPALDESYEALFHAVPLPNFYLDFSRHLGAATALQTQRLERAIGVLYRPESERVSHYFAARLPLQFDAVFHYDTTRAVEPLERSAVWERGEFPETYPSAL
jgi:erythromycin esterase-like protein